MLHYCLLMPTFTRLDCHHPPQPYCISPNYAPNMRAVSPLTMTSSWPGVFRLACRSRLRLRLVSVNGNADSFATCSATWDTMSNDPASPLQLAPLDASLVSVATCAKFAHATNELKSAALTSVALLQRPPARLPRGNAEPNANQFAASASVAMTHAAAP